MPSLFPPRFCRICRCAFRYAVSHGTFRHERPDGVYALLPFPEVGGAQQPAWETGIFASRLSPHVDPSCGCSCAGQDGGGFLSAPYPCRNAGCASPGSGLCGSCSPYAAGAAAAAADSECVSRCACLFFRSSCSPCCLTLLCAWSSFADPAASRLHPLLP